MSGYQPLEVVVTAIESLSDRVKCFTLADPEGAPLPPFRGGSHILVPMPGNDSGYGNAYSLISSPFDTRHYQIAVRRESPSRGGSAFMHDALHPGDRLTISTPENLFALAGQADNHLLIAGGIGITPFLSFLPELQHAGQRYHLHYAFHSARRATFREWLQRSPYASHVSCHDSSQGDRLDLERLLAGAGPATHIYVCGPGSLNDAVRHTAERLGIPAERLHSEAFTPQSTSGHTFTLVLARSGVELTVGPEMTILQALENSGAARVESLCREGICGTCETKILEGEAEHRDQYLSDEERSAQKTLLVCCSRAKGDRLVLDL